MQSDSVDAVDLFGVFKRRLNCHLIVHPGFYIAARSSRRHCYDSD